MFNPQLPSADASSAWQENSADTPPQHARADSGSAKAALPSLSVKKQGTRKWLKQQPDLIQAPKMKSGKFRASSVAAHKESQALKLGMSSAPGCLFQGPK